MSMLWDGEGAQLDGQLLRGPTLSPSFLAAAHPLKLT
jgi:hypothetical protein